MARQETAPDTEGKTDLGGMFYPVGYIVAAFSGDDEAKKTQQALEQHGFTGSACRMLDGRTYASMARRELAENTGFFATLGKTDEVLQRGLEAADQGAAFVLIHVPRDEDAVRATQALRGAPMQFAYRYHSLAIEELPV